MVHNVSLVVAVTFLGAYVRWMLQLDDKGSVHYSTAPKWITLSGNMGGSEFWSLAGRLISRKYVTSREQCGLPVTKLT